MLHILTQRRGRSVPSLYSPFVLCLPRYLSLFSFFPAPTGTWRKDRKCRLTKGVSRDCCAVHGEWASGRQEWALGEQEWALSGWDWERVVWNEHWVRRILHNRLNGNGFLFFAFSHSVSLAEAADFYWTCRLTGEMPANSSLPAFYALCCSPRPSCEFHIDSARVRFFSDRTEFFFRRFDSAR